ncbi:MAG: Asp-tRNA(Asn)/Glu-tRNA(Gln) amidotransferase subunit GatB [Bacteroidota bacterium]
MSNAPYKAVIGLEVHAQLLTKTKMFSPEAASYGALPNTQVSAITLAHPGALPSINKEAIDYALTIGLACHCKITKYNSFARKNYFYADLPKGFQISQDKTPICTGGYIPIQDPTTKEEKKIRLQRIHLEEDTGKSLHDLIPGHTLLDFNRAGTPLVEIVTKPDITTPEEAYQCLTEIRRLVRYLDICDGNMEEGSLRCDANISVMRTTDTKLGTRVEIKNLNSIRNVQLALTYEIARHTEILKQGGTLTEETRSFDASQGITIHQRSKETLSEYRYFPEPNLSPVIIDDAWKQRIAEEMPLLPSALLEKFKTTYGLSDYHANVLVSEKEIALFFEAICEKLPEDPKAVANWVLGPIKSYLNEYKITLQDFPLTPSTLAQLIQIVTEGTLGFSTASQNLFPALIKEPNADPRQLADQLGLIPIKDASQTESWVDEVINAFPDKVKIYQAGKKGLLGFFISQVLQKSEKKADPKTVAALLKEKLG